MEKVLIIGSGPAGLTAAIYTARAQLKPLVVSGLMAGGQLTTTTEVENYPGFPKGVQGPELVELMRQQAERFGTRFVAGDVTEVDLKNNPFRVRVDDKEFESKAVIIATGASSQLLGLESEKKLFSRGISVCATCDGFFYKDRKVAVVGGGDSALEEALFLTRFASMVTVIHRRDKLRASKIMQERVLNHEKIEVAWNSTVDEFLGEEKLVGIRLKDTVSGDTREMECDGVFVAIGHIPNNQVFGDQIERDEKGYIRLEGRRSLTSVEGVFCAGDVHDSWYRQAITAAGSGCMAAIDCERYLEGLGE